MPQQRSSSLKPTSKGRQSSSKSSSPPRATAAANTSPKSAASSLPKVPPSPNTANAKTTPNATPVKLPGAREEPKYAPPQPSFLAEKLWFPFYDNFVKFYPKWWTPNGITLFGIFSTVLSSAILLAAMPSMMEPFGASRSQFAAPSQTAEMAANTFLRKNGVESDILETVTGNYIDGLRHRKALGNGLGLYGKPITIAPASVLRAVHEAIEIVQHGAVSAAPNVTDKDGKALLGRANRYDFERPQLFYQALQTPLSRAEVAVSVFWNGIVNDIFGFAKQAWPETHGLVFGTIEKAAVMTYNFFTGCATRACSLFPASFEATPGRWMLIIGGILNLVYCVADNTDGRHARRTKQSSFVGEYLDHGLDCVTSLLTTYLLGSALGLEAAQAAVALLAIAFATVLSHLVNQERGFLIWGNRAFTVDEAMIAFGVGMIVVGIYPSFIPATVPVGALAALGIPSSWIPPALAHVRVGELIWFGFLVSQLSVVFTLVTVDRTVVFRPSSLALVANIAAIWYFTNTIGQPSILRDDVFATAAGTKHPITGIVTAFGLDNIGLLRALDTALNLVFVYEAQWVILAACTCSIVIHAPIAAKCLKIAKGTDNKPIVLTLPLAIFTFFFISSGIGAAIAVIGHVIQILTNVNKLQKRGKERARLGK